MTSKSEIVDFFDNEDDGLGVTVDEAVRIINSLRVVEELNTARVKSVVEDAVDYHHHHCQISRLLVMPTLQGFNFKLKL